MPDCLDAAVQALTAEGVAHDVARRAAVAALWVETGRLPSPGVESDVDLLPRAREFVALAEAQDVACLQAQGALEELATFAEADAPEAPSSPRVLREAHLRHPAPPPGRGEPPNPPEKRRNPRLPGGFLVAGARVELATKGL